MFGGLTRTFCGSHLRPNRGRSAATIAAAAGGATATEYRPIVGRSHKCWIRFLITCVFLRLRASGG